MCELLGMECNVPTDIVFSFSGLSLRGGERGPHADGWGLSLYEGRAVRSFLEPAAAAGSKLAARIAARLQPIGQHGIRCGVVGVLIDRGFEGGV